MLDALNAADGRTVEIVIAPGVSPSESVFTGVLLQDGTAPDGSLRGWYVALGSDDAPLGEIRLHLDRYTHVGLGRAEGDLPAPVVAQHGEARLALRALPSPDAA